MAMSEAAAAANLAYGKNNAGAVDTTTGAIVNSENQNVTGHSCRTCKQADNSRMVQCDDCDSWHHFTCVGVSDEVEYNDWYCNKCASVRLLKEKQKYTGTKSKKFSAKPAEEEDKKKVIPRKLKEKPKKQIENVQTRNVQVSVSMPDGRLSKASSVKSTASRKSTKAVLELKLRKLQAEQTLLDERRKLLDKQYSVMKELSELQIEQEDENNDVYHNSKVNDWLSENPTQQVSVHTDSEESGDSFLEEDSDRNSETFENSTDDAGSDEASVSKRSFKPEFLSTPKKGKSRHKSNKHFTVTGSNQISCRKRPQK
ncbi:uncharacterized protein LOC131430392 [Malaya genurostris]|uniref:uncharacterized protein LOC131430392 n=1 Tax=Malaya genurostris TaxID=325434 RepID=UPI0026F3B52C|nr:uncharacterized protein LOC131430392 [Malaya genurostris]